MACFPDKNLLWTTGKRVANETLVLRKRLPLNRSGMPS